MGYKNSVW